MHSLTCLFILLVGFFFICLVIASPIASLFFFLAIITLCGFFLIGMNLPYLGFLLISVYGGAIVVLFLMVAMLFNKKTKKHAY